MTDGSSEQAQDGDSPSESEAADAGTTASGGSGGPDGPNVRAGADPDRDLIQRVARAGRVAWAIAGIAVVLAIIALVSSQLALIIIPVILALFPATLLVPVSDRMKERGVPDALAALATIVAGILLILGIFAAMIPIVAMQLPDLIESAGQGVGELREVLEGFGVEVGGVGEIMEAAREQAGEVGEFAGEALSAAVVAVETVTGLVLLFVVLFFYLKDGRRLRDGMVSTAPAHLRPHAAEIAERSWETLGAYFRGQLLVALINGVFIGIGLLVLGVPLAIPLAVLIFFGGLFPVIGALVTGTLAVLVALADAGLVTGLVVLGLVILVQQVEGNVLAPMILGHAIQLHPLVVLLAITAGAITLGVLGAFLAVPVAAIIAEIVEYLREDAQAHAESAT